MKNVLIGFVVFTYVGLTFMMAGLTVLIMELVNPWYLKMLMLGLGVAAYGVMMFYGLRNDIRNLELE